MPCFKSNVEEADIQYPCQIRNDALAIYEEM